MTLSLSALSDGICDYLKMLAVSDVTDGTFDRHCRVLRNFYQYIKGKGIKPVFSQKTVNNFFDICPLYNARSVIRQFSKFLYEQNRIDKPFGRYKIILPEPYAAYLVYQTDTWPDNIWIHRIVLASFYGYLETKGIELSRIALADIDDFLSITFSHLSIETQNKYRSSLRGFLRYLFNHHIIHKNIAPWVVGKRMFERSLPPRYLQVQEIRQLFGNMAYDTEGDLRANAMVYLAFTLGLRPKEISRISLDDIRFESKELKIPNRKNNQPAVLPLSDETIKAITAYIIGGRPQGEERTLFLYLGQSRPLTYNRVSKEITACMRRSGLSASSYHLRHTYAQQLLEKGVSVFEIKEMMGHKTLKTARRYLHVHIPLMRKVLFDEIV